MPRIVERRPGAGNAAKLLADADPTGIVGAMVCGIGASWPRSGVAVVAAAALVACRTPADHPRAASADSAAATATVVGPPRPASGLSATPEATSLLGEPLFPLVLDSAAVTTMRAQLDSAEAALAADPDDTEALIWVGRRLGYLGQYRAAIATFGTGIRRHPDDARLYRHRGHRFISIRELDRAIADLEHAARLVGGRRDEIEPDGQPNPAGIPRSTLHTNIWYHLGLARYVAGDFTGAAHAFQRGLELSPNDDMRVAMADWLYLALVRTGRRAEAEDLLGSVLRPDMDILENRSYERRLRLYAGELAPDSLLPPGSDALAVATYGYGLGTWHLLRGDTAAARAAYSDVLATGYWPAFGYLAAEAELARMRTSPEP